MSEPASDLEKRELAGTRARRRVFARLLPWLLLLYIIAYIDRVNVSFATLEMSADLGFSPLYPARTILRP